MEKIKTITIRTLPTGILIRSLRKLSVIDRLNCQRVSPRWKWIIGEWGWTEEKRLDFDSVFEGTTPENTGGYIQRFYELSGAGKCNLVSLLDQIGPNLVELNLGSLQHNSLQQFLPEMAQSLKSMKKLEKLNIAGFELADFVAYLPSTLRELETLENKVKLDDIFEEVETNYEEDSPPNITLETIKTLSEKCPNLTEVPFDRVIDITLDTLNELIGRFPRQKQLYFIDMHFAHKLGGPLTSIVGLKELEDLSIGDFTGFDADLFEAMVTGCTNIRVLYFRSCYPLMEKSLFLLAKMSNLTVLEVDHDECPEFTDAVLREIADQGKLMRLSLLYSEPSYTYEPISDDSIVYLIDRCKSLVSLDLFICSLGERSLEAVVAEVHRRHGTAPWRSLPVGPWDSGVFFFNCTGADIEEGRARQITAENPWLTVVYFDDYVDDPREFI